MYEATRGKDTEPFVLTEQQQQAFEALKQTLTRGPAVGLPDVNVPFSLFVAESMEVLTQAFGDKQCPCAYLSKKIDSVAADFPGCLRVVAAEALLLHDAKKLTSGSKIIVKTNHALRPLLQERGMNCMTNSRTFKYQAELLEDPNLELQTCSVLNPVTFLPNEKGNATPEHDCITTVQQTWKPRSAN